MAISTTRVESFPFDSLRQGYDDYGYPVYDRAVGATLLRYTYEKFFTDGVFGTPSNALEIGKASSGLAVTIQPGVFIINGAMGGIAGDPITVTLDTSAPKGRVPYAVMLRYDNTQEKRSLYITVEKGSASATPVPPEPDKTTPSVMEYRLGWVDVPSGATDLSGATVHNEKGTALCPYTNPFNEVDLSSVVNDAKNDANDAVNSLLDSISQYYGMIEGAIDETYAGQVETRLQAVESEIEDIASESITSDKVDNVTIGFSDVDTDDTTDPKFHVIPSGARAAMGLGNTTGVLQPEYGGTGLTSLEALKNSFDFMQEFSVSVNVTGVNSFGTSVSVNLPAGIWWLDRVVTTTITSSVVHGDVLLAESSSFGSGSEISKIGDITKTGTKTGSPRLGTIYGSSNNKDNKIGAGLGVIFLRSSSTFYVKAYKNNPQGDGTFSATAYIRGFAFN